MHSRAESTTAVATTSLNRGDAIVAFVGHGGGPTRNGKFTSEAVELNGGEIGITGVRPTRHEADGSVTVLGSPTAMPADNATVTVFMTCNSADRMLSTVNLTGSNQSVIGNTGGTDGLTSVGALENANYALIDKYISTMDVKQAVDAGQAELKKSTLAADNNGDKIKKLP